MFYLLAASHHQFLSSHSWVWLWNLMQHLKLKMPTGFAALILGVLSHLLIRDWHNCGSCEAISSSLSLIADYHSPESPYSPRSQIPNVCIAALAAVAIFKPSSCRWTYWIINKLRSSRTDDVIRLASPRQLCILDVCQSGCVLLPSLYSRLTSPCADTNWCSKLHARITESPRPCFGVGPSWQKGSSIETDSLCAHTREVKLKSRFPWPLSFWGNQGWRLV